MKHPRTPSISLSVRTLWNNTYSNEKPKSEAKWLPNKPANVKWEHQMHDESEWLLFGQNRLIIKLKSDTEFPDRAGDLLCSWDSGWIPSPSCLGSACYWPRGARGGRGPRLVQFHHNDGKLYSEHIPRRRGCVASSAFQLGPGHACPVGRCLMTALCDGDNDEGKTHF